MHCDSMKSITYVVIPTAANAGVTGPCANPATTGEKP